MAAAAASSKKILKSSSSALNLLIRTNPVQFPLRGLPIIESTASRFMLFNQKLVSEEKMQQLSMSIEGPRTITEEMLMAGYPRKYADIERDFDDEEEEETDDDSDIDMIDEEEDDEDDDDDDEFEDEEEEFVKTKVRTRSHRDL